MVCEHCHNYKVFGKKCWYYWEGKQSCSQYKKGAGNEPEVFDDEFIHITP